MNVTHDLNLTYCGLHIRLRLPTCALQAKFATVLGPLLCVRRAQIDLETVVARRCRFLRDHVRWFSGMEKVGRRVFRRWRERSASS